MLSHRTLPVIGNGHLVESGGKLAERTRHYRTGEWMAMSGRYRSGLQHSETLNRKASQVPVPGEICRRAMQFAGLHDCRFEKGFRLRGTKGIARQQSAIVGAVKRNVARSVPRSMQDLPAGQLRQ